MAAARVPRGQYGARLKYVLLLPAVVWVIAFTFLPLVSVIRYSFAAYVLGRGITGYVGLANYVEVLSSARFWHSMMVTTIYVAVSVPAEVVLGFLVAWLVHLGPPGTRTFRTVIGAPLGGDHGGRDVAVIAHNEKENVRGRGGGIQLAVKVDHRIRFVTQQFGDARAHVRVI